MFYLMMHSTHFFLTVIWCWTYGKGPLRKREGNLLPLHAVLLISTQAFFYKHHPTVMIARTMAFITPVMEH